MKLIAFEAAGRRSFGVVEDGKVIDLEPRLPGVWSLDDLLTPDAQAKAAAAAKGASADYDLADIRFLRPIARPEKVICIGVNYANRSAEYTDTSESEFPSVFMRTPDSLVAHKENLIRPIAESDQLDYEGEIGLIIGKGGRRIARDAALSHIGALTCINEGSVRDWMRHGKFNVTQGKNFDRSGAIGPWLVTPDEFPTGYGEMQVTTRVNGEVRQDDNTANIIYPFDYLISYISKWTALKPGDIISTGTPVGAGARFKPPKWLKPGDTVEVEVTGIGILNNGIADG